MGSSVRTEARKQKIENAGPPARDNDEIIRPHISGKFRGWTGNTTFQLKKDQVWQRIDKESRFFPKTVSPGVGLFPSNWAGWKLTLVNEGLWVKVKRIHPL